VSKRGPRPEVALHLNEDHVQEIELTSRFTRGKTRITLKKELLQVADVPNEELRLRIHQLLLTQKDLSQEAYDTDFIVSWYTSNLCALDALLE
jgi:hypothetical protein